MLSVLSTSLAMIPLSLSLGAAMGMTPSFQRDA